MTEEWHRHSNAIDVTYFITDKLSEALKLIRDISDLLNDEDLFAVCDSSIETCIDTVMIEDEIMKGMGRIVETRERITENHPKE